MVGSDYLPGWGIQVQSSNWSDKLLVLPQSHAIGWANVAESGSTNG